LALEIARALDGTLLLVVNDLPMPVLGWLEFAREILRTPFRAEVFLGAVARLLEQSPGARHAPA
jgi:hypothetical protein